MLVLIVVHIAKISMHRPSEAVRPSEPPLTRDELSPHAQRTVGALVVAVRGADQVVKGTGKGLRVFRWYASDLAVALAEEVSGLFRIASQFVQPRLREIGRKLQVCGCASVASVVRGSCVAARCARLCVNASCNQSFLGAQRIRNRSADAFRGLHRSFMNSPVGDMLRNATLRRQAVVRCSRVTARCARSCVRASRKQPSLWAHRIRNRSAEAFRGLHGSFMNSTVGDMLRNATIRRQVADTPPLVAHRGDPQVETGSKSLYLPLFGDMDHIRTGARMVADQHAKHRVALDGVLGGFGQVVRAEVSRLSVHSVIEGFRKRAQHFRKHDREGGC